MYALNEHGKALKGARILMLGLAYKPNVDDDRESPSYHLMEMLENRGATVSYNDHYIPIIKPSREFSKFAGRRSVEISGDYDLILVSTDHDEYKSLDLAVYNIPVVDTRNIINGRKNPLFYKA
jgi:UDP-N-acetyl-D-glucosamine dehydrogenase